MNGKAIIGVAAAAALALLVYFQFFKGASEDDTANVRASFNSFTLGLASSNPVMTQVFISQGFSDTKIGKEDFMKMLGIRRKLYNAVITSVTMQGDFSSISYNRTEVRGDDGDSLNSKINGETWIRDKEKPGMWKLYKLADNDTWFRSLEIPVKRAMVEVKKDTRVLGTLEGEQGKSAAMKPGDRYASIGRRDPFRSLVSVGGAEVEGVSVDLCEPDRPRELLEGYDLESLRLTGIVTSDKGPAALIETPDGKGYTVYSGMYLGRRCGKVMEMQSDFVQLKEKIRKPGAAPGVYSTIDTILQLRREEG
ncbi:MAG: pilus assembly protein PilP [Nitrospinae bacterium]|nr:pilus assembly protein PilP [Nitrospinota bacterium]